MFGILLQAAGCGLIFLSIIAMCVALSRVEFREIPVIDKTGAITLILAFALLIAGGILGIVGRSV